LPRISSAKKPKARKPRFAVESGVPESQRLLKGVPMLWTTSIILLSFWLLGVTTPFTMHGYIHLLLIVAAAVVLIPSLRKKGAVD
jgi:hypothetical protein